MPVDARLRLLERSDNLPALIRAHQRCPNWNVTKRLQLCTRNTSLCRKGRIPADHYAVIRKATLLQDLGSEIRVSFISYRPIALDWSAPYRVSYDTENPLFWENSPTVVKGKQYLVLVNKELMTFACLAKSFRPDPDDLIGKTKILGVKNHDNRRFVWSTPLIKEI